MRKKGNGFGRTPRKVPVKPVVIGSNSGERRRRVEYDPELDTVLDLIKDMSPAEVVMSSGNLIGKNTIYNWRRGKVRTPLAYTIRAAYKAAGYELVAKKIKN
jgi:hypothetical protein